jgi:hypothetical protein
LQNWENPLSGCWVGGKQLAMDSLDYVNRDFEHFEWVWLFVLNQEVCL